MTEVEKMQRAKLYLEKLAEGINPIDDTVVPENDVINNIHISRCFFYVSDILKQLIENGTMTNSTKSVQKSPFFLTDKQKKQYVPSDKPICITEFAKSLNCIIDLDKYQKLKYSTITDWLQSIGAISVHTNINGKAYNRPTAQGNELGISTDTRTGPNGDHYVVVYNRAAQQFIIDNIDAIIAFKKESMERGADNQGQPWTQSQEDSLVDLFTKNVPISKIAAALLRTEGGIRARLKKLGLIDNRSDV